MGSLSPITVESGDLLGVEWAWASRPCAGERVSGDMARVLVLEDRLHVSVVDVLGHGREAHSVAKRIDAFLEGRDLSNAAAVLTELHGVLRNTVGASVGIGTFDPATGALTWAAVGNAAARRLGDSARLVSRDGILGQILPEIRTGSLSLGDTDAIVLHTDGVPSGLDPEEYPQWRVHGARAIAWSLVHQFGRTTDDATALVLRRAR